MPKISKKYAILENEMKEIAERYFVCKRELLKQRLSSGENDFSLSAVYVKRVNHAFSCLKQQEQNIINNDFFYSTYSDWWESSFHKNKYFVIKKEAMRNFLRHFYANV